MKKCLRAVYYLIFFVLGVCFIKVYDSLDQALLINKVVWEAKLLRGDQLAAHLISRPSNIPHDLQEPKQVEFTMELLSSSSRVKRKDMILKRPKLITVLNSEPWLNLSMNNKTFSKCKISTCQISHNESMLYNSDAVLFYVYNYKPTVPPERKRKNQVWIFATWEPPLQGRMSSFKPAAWHNQFNWTLGFREDSELFAPYGEVYRSKKYSKDYTKIISQKKELVAWVASNCHAPSKRLMFVKELSKTTNIDVFGKCGSRKLKNFDEIHTKYKFYLSLENSFCKDYVTEKFFYRQTGNIVPVVRGSANYTRFYPKGSFIDVQDFKSIEDLGRYLNYLDKNDTAYITYLKAKEGLKVKALTSNIVASMCKLCEMLHQPLKYHHVYKNVYEWYTKDQCKIPNKNHVISVKDKWVKF